MLLGFSVGGLRSRKDYETFAKDPTRSHADEGR